MMDAMKVAAVLRRAAENAGCGLHAVMSGGGDCPEFSCNGCSEVSAAWANEAADAIERCAMPDGVEWPRFEDGKLDWGFEAAFLTHAKPEPPDTWQRIEDDATLPPREYYARYVGHDVGLKDDEEVNGAFGKSLVRRCRALAERGER